MSNKSEGNKFEREFSDALFKAGYFVHRVVQNTAGQPADIIAVRNGEALMIDCKVCQNDEFRLARIEPNQILSMSLWEDRGNLPCQFAMKTSVGVYLVKFRDLMYLKGIGESKLSLEAMQELGQKYDI